MKIQNITKNNNFTFTKCAITPKKTDPIHYHDKFQYANYPIETGYASFVRSKENAFADFLNKKGKVTQEEYEKIKKYAPAILVKAYEKVDADRRYNVSPLSAVKCALSLKDYCDEKYGNYQIVSIGTSPDFFTRLMPALGCEAVFVPISDCLKLQNCDNTFGELSENKKILELVNYLQEKHISNNKTSVIVDYVLSGASINLTEKMLTDFLHINKANISKISIANFFDTKNKLSYPLSTSEYLKLFSFEIPSETVSCISNTPHYSVAYSPRDVNQAPDLSGDELIQYFDDYSTPSSRAFALCTLNELQKIKKSGYKPD